MSEQNLDGIAVVPSSARCLRWRMDLFVGAVVLTIASLASGSSRADFVLGFGQTNYLVGPGQGVDVSVFLSESGTNILATDGLNSAGLVVSFNLPPMVSNPAQVTSITPNPGVNDVDDFVTSSINPATASAAGTAELLFSVVLSDVLKPPPGSSSVLLGAFHFDAGSVPGQVTSLTVAIAPGGSQFLSGTGQALDSMITTGTATITTLPVPEPSSGVFLVEAAALGLLCLAGDRRRRKTAASTNPRVVTERGRVAERGRR
jgi:hypothetical protein